MKIWRVLWKIDQEFMASFNFIIAKDIFHLEAKPYTCENCGKGFKQYYYLKEHISCVHEGINSYFFYLWLYRSVPLGLSFIRLCLGARPFKCCHCEKALASNKSLKNHIARFHNFG